MHALARIAALLLFVLLFPVAMAHADGSITRSGTEYTFTGTDDDDELSVWVHAMISFPDHPGYRVVFVGGEGDTLTTSAAGCSPVPGNRIICDDPAAPSLIVANGHGGADTLAFVDFFLFGCFATHACRCLRL